MIFKREPAVIIGIIAAFIGGGFVALGSAGYLDASTVATISAALAFGLPIVQGIVTRFFVSPATGA